MKFTPILQQLDNIIQSRSILTHPFYIAWQQGELTRNQLGTYAMVYYPHVAAFPRYLQLAIEGTDDEYIREELLQNLRDELNNPKPHTELWLDFAEEFGLGRSVVTDAPEHPAARNIVETFERLAGTGEIKALAALYAYESQQPTVSKEKAEGLRQFYGVSDPKSLAYFEVHAETDIHHCEGERKAIDHCLDKGGSRVELLLSAGEALEAYWELLDGICLETGIPMTCE